MDLKNFQSRRLSWITPRFAGVFFMICCATIVSFGGLIYRNFQDIEILEIVFFRSISLVSYMGVFLFFKYRLNFFRHMSDIGLKGIFASAIFCSAQVSWLIALNFTSVANATFTLCLTPFITALVAYFFVKETISRVTFLTMFLALIGVSIMVFGGLKTEANTGLLAALYTSIAFSVFAVTLRSNRNLDMLPVLLLTGVFMGFIGGFGGSFSDSIPLKDILLCVIWGVVLQGFAHSLMIRASRLILSAEITLFMLLEFTLGPFWVWLFLNEIPVMTTLIGGGVIIFSVGVLTGSEIRGALRPNRKLT
ncbi:MAG: DMT family transporter [Paracoccaceae bacterium]|nr:DMT family transporter [Paracoccaceae bacterium]